MVQAVVADLVPDDGADLVVRHLRQHRVEETDAPEPRGAAGVVTRIDHPKIVLENRLSMIIENRVSMLN